MVNSMQHHALQENSTLMRALAAFQAGTDWPARLLPETGLAPKALPQVVFSLPGQALQFSILVKSVERFASLGLLKAKIGAQQTLLVAPYVSNALAKHCRELDLPFIDEAGNAYLSAPGVLIFISGNPRPAMSLPVVNFRALNATGLRIVFAMLSQPGLLNATYRELAKLAGVALGTIGPVLADLQARGMLIIEKNGTRRLPERNTLIDEWVTHYPMRLRPKLASWRMAAAQANWWQNATLPRQEAWWGGEVAAARLTGLLKPASCTIYAKTQPTGLFLAQRLRPTPMGDVEIVEAFWQGSVPEDAADCVPPLLVYADLINSGEARNIETAQMIRERYLDD